MNWVKVVLYIYYIVDNNNNLIRIAIFKLNDQYNWRKVFRYDVIIMLNGTLFYRWSFSFNKWVDTRFFVEFHELQGYVGILILVFHLDMIVYELYAQAEDSLLWCTHKIKSIGNERKLNSLLHLTILYKMKNEEIGLKGGSKITQLMIWKIIHIFKFSRFKQHYEGHSISSMISLRLSYPIWLNITDHNSYTKLSRLLTSKNRMKCYRLNDV